MKGFAGAFFFDFLDIEGIFRGKLFFACGEAFPVFIHDDDSFFIRVIHTTLDRFAVDSPSAHFLLGIGGIGRKRKGEEGEKREVFDRSVHIKVWEGS